MSCPAGSCCQGDVCSDEWTCNTGSATCAGIPGGGGGMVGAGCTSPQAVADHQVCTDAYETCGTDCDTGWDTCYAGCSQACASDTACLNPCIEECQNALAVCKCDCERAQSDCYKTVCNTHACTWLPITDDCSTGTCLLF
jgi:hypothetical protein